MPDDRAFHTLIEYLLKVPGITGTIGTGTFDDGRWWVKFRIDPDHPLAWHVVQEFGNVLNYLSVQERLPTLFVPVSPPAYLNGGPREFLSWVIEAKDTEFKPGTCMKWLEGRLPKPVEDLTQWKTDED
ncbi:MAG: hypothetical protein JWR69_781 [Pedosphaera sp.]|nr:hypothetical protein [Pedosphaera sp.]